MGSTRQIVKVFLASPGDLAEERKAAKAIADDFNAQWAEVLGYQVELVGWEDTVSVYGRPQAIINRELERCELFVGLMWKKWGTPPDIGGVFSSGFEEEFELSASRRSKEGRPEISLYFKQIPQEFLVDPGDDLKKVIAFQNRLIAEKKILYEQFSDPRDFERKFQRCLSRYVASLWQISNEGVSKERAAPSVEENMPSPASDSGSSQDRQMSVEATSFLQEFVEMAEQSATKSPLGPVDIARFRLLSTLVGTSGNDELLLGVHDANLIFAQDHGSALSFREIDGLVTCGLSRLADENVPLWGWLAKNYGPERACLPLFSMVSIKVRRRVGALMAMTLVSQPLPSGIARHHFLDSWFADDSSSAVRMAALRYLTDCGQISDIPAIRREFDRNDTKTSATAAESIILINLRDGRDKALSALYELQPASLRQEVLDAIFEKDSAIGTADLLAGATHVSRDVRRTIVRILRRRKTLPNDLAEQLLSDDDAFVRFQALAAVISSGRVFSDEEVKKILVKPSAGLGLLYLATSDAAGEAQYKEYRQMRLRALSKDALQTVIADEHLVDREAGFILDGRDFPVRAQALRNAVDDQFEAEYASYLKELGEVIRVGDKALAQARELEQFVRRDLTRKALDVLCRKAKVADLLRVRSLLLGGFVDCSPVDIDYLKKFGDWEDISTIIGCFKRPSLGRALSILDLPDNAMLISTARGLYALGKSRFADLVATEMPGNLLCYIVANATRADFQRLKNIEIASLLSHADDKVRKASVLKSIQSLSRGRVAALSANYLAEDTDRYYNVIHWLDFGLSTPRDQVHAAVRKTLRQLWPLF
jgi:hypothetical protein